ncbi:MAG: hypothetical protein GXY36_04470 [Chloroflexi bacterium]|nr:hypothetical protein [Chloroflexota bacterium]
MSSSKSLRDWLARLVKAMISPSEPQPERAGQQPAVAALRSRYGVAVIEHDPKGNARPWRPHELALITETLDLLGPTFYRPFQQHPLQLWIDRNPGGGGFGNGWLRIGEPGDDPSILYRILLHESTHASNEYRGWPYENQFCTRPGLDWRKAGDQWVHPRQQGQPPQPGDWETLPVDSRDVSVAPGEDLAESVRYYVHSVRNERAWLWPLDQSQPPLYLWDTSPTRFVYVRDYFLALPPDHPLYKRLPPDVEARAAANLAG